MLAFIAYRLISNAWAPTQIDKTSIELLMNNALLLAYYTSGRIIASSRDGRHFALEMLVGFLLIPLAYVLSPNLQQLWDRQIFVGATAVGLSYPLNIWIVVGLAVVLFAWKARNMRGPDANTLPGQVAWTLGPVAIVWGTLLLLDNGSRGALLGAAVALAAALWIGGSRRLQRQILLAGVPLAVALVFIHLFEAAIVEWVGTLGRDRFSRLVIVALETLGLDTGYSIEDYAFRAREVVQALAVSQFVNSPLIGCGYTCTTPSTLMYPHNIFLEVAAELGLVGLSMFATLVLAAVYRAAATISEYKNLTMFSVALVLLALLVQHQVSYFMDIARMLFFALGALVVKEGGIGARESERTSLSFSAGHTLDR